jgi:hypothetical protein
MMTLALAFAAPAVAASPAVSTGDFEGQKFEYATRLGAADTILIEGKFVRGDDFSFTVKPSGYVTGEVGRRSVSFRVSKEERDSLASSLKRAAEPQVASR